MRAGGQANTGGRPPSCGVGLYYWVASGRRCGAGQLGVGPIAEGRGLAALMVVAIVSIWMWVLLYLFIGLQP